ncbi:hypothetical protein ACN47E_004483 [Coniothyrium glycines]
MSKPLVVVVTGANRGIGRAICEHLAKHHTSPLVLYAASRAGAEPDIKSTTVTLKPARLSLTDSSTIDSLASAIKSAHGGCDVVINNAGVYYYSENITPQQRRETLDANYKGTLRVCQTFIPIMRPGGRIVNLSSQSGQLHYFAPELRKRFLDPAMTLDQLSKLVAEYSDVAAKGEEAERGWPPMTYFTSKAALNAGTRILARDNPDLLINCCCPGWVSTDLGSQAGKPPKTSEEGARVPLHLAFGDIGNVSGRYWANDSVSGKGSGKVQDW